MTWRDISTAPRDDGKPILAWDGVGVVIAYPYGDGGWIDTHALDCHVLAWAPIPDPPSSTTESERLEVLEGK